MSKNLLSRLLSNKLGRTAFIAVVCLFVGIFSADNHQKNEAVISINNQLINVEVANTPSMQLKGLSGRADLANDQGMLFVFRDTEKHCFWMKDMRFNLDIYWFNAAKRLIYTEKNLAPESYPKNFCPPTVSKYVLEVKAGSQEINEIEKFEFVKK